MMKIKMMKYYDSFQIDKKNLKVECYSSQDLLLSQNKSKHLNKVGLSSAKLSRSCSWSVGLL